MNLKIQKLASDLNANLGTYIDKLRDIEKNLIAINAASEELKKAKKQGTKLEQYLTIDDINVDLSEIDDLLDGPTPMYLDIVNSLFRAQQLLESRQFDICNSIADLVNQSNKDITNAFHEMNSAKG